MPLARPARAAALLAAGSLLLTGCGDSKATTAKAAVTLDNCGHEVRVETPPKHAVSLNQGTTEILLSLGLADRLAGTATWTDPVMKGLAKANAKVPRIADNNPSFERVLDADPDFVAASFVSTLGKGGVATREQFEKLGVPTYVSPSDCAGKDNSGDGDGARDKALGIDTIYGEVRDLATVFGVQERGDRLVASLQRRMAKATRGIERLPTSLSYWSGQLEVARYMAGCPGGGSAPSAGPSAPRTSSTTRTRSGRRSTGRRSPTATPTSSSSATSPASRRPPSRPRRRSPSWSPTRSPRRWTRSGTSGTCCSAGRP
ncbi:hypothetical protein SAFG77S_02802 [Streptomyces afghaniensis]